MDENKAAFQPLNRCLYDCNSMFMVTCYSISNQSRLDQLKTHKLEGRKMSEYSVVQVLSNFNSGKLTDEQCNYIFRTHKAHYPLHTL